MDQKYHKYIDKGKYRQGQPLSFKDYCMKYHKYIVKVPE